MEKIDVRIGQVKSGNCVLLETNAIGSCLAVVAYDSAKKNGAMAHIMLPGRAPAGKENIEKTKYAADAIEEIIRQMRKLGSECSNIKVILAGGGNVLKKENDTICRENIESVLDILQKKKMKIVAKAVGGFERRNVTFDADRGVVKYSEGDAKNKILWKK